MLQRCKGKGGKRGWRWGPAGRQHFGSHAYARARRDGGVVANVAAPVAGRRHTHNRRANPLRADPTQMALPRRKFVGEMRRRFKAFRSAVWQLVVVEDAFGLSQVPGFPLNLETNTTKGRWKFHTSADKLDEFKRWMKKQLRGKILGDPARTDDDWWRKYCKEGYLKGAARAFKDTKRGQGESIGSFYEGSKREFLRSSFGQPVAAEKVQLLAERVFTDLEGVTEAMGTKITRELADGLVEGKSPYEIAKDMVDEIDDMTEKRAELIARTELTRAHAEGQLDALEDMGMDEVGVMVEWLTSPDERLCDACAELEGVVLTIDEARGLIPRHPNCRCAFTPANVGEEKDEQIRGKKKIEEAFEESMDIDGGSDKTRWVGADKEIARTRPKDLLDTINTDIVTHGGPGSGNFGHAGRPGERGGSGPGGGITHVPSKGLEDMKKGGTEAEIKQFKRLTSDLTKLNKMIKQGKATPGDIAFRDSTKSELDALRAKVRARLAGKEPPPKTDSRKIEPPKVEPKKSDPKRREPMARWEMVETINMHPGLESMRHDVASHYEKETREIDILVGKISTNHVRMENHRSGRQTLSPDVHEAVIDETLALSKERRAREENLNKAIHEKLKLDRNLPRARMSVVAEAEIVGDPVSDRHVEMTDKAKDFLRDMTLARKDTNGNLRDCRITCKLSNDPDCRAFSTPGGATVVLGKTDPLHTYVHEYGHQLEEQLGLDHASRNFLAHRVEKSGTPYVNLKQKFGGSYKDDEIGNEDSFRAAFSASGHSEMYAYYTGKYYAHGSTEIMSMGLQLLHENPGHFAKADPEFFKFIVGALHGHIR